MFEKIFKPNKFTLLFFIIALIWVIVDVFFKSDKRPSAIDQNNKQEILTTSARKELTKRSENLGYNVIDIHCDKTMFEYSKYFHDNENLCVVKTDSGNLFI